MNILAYLSLLAQWPYDPTVIIGLVITGVLYWRGVRYMRTHGLGRHLRPWRIGLFFLGLAVIFFALNSPLDDWADTYLWMHMIQHELLAMIAAPLLLLGDPAMIILRGIPLKTRRVSLKWVVKQKWPVTFFESLADFFRRPVVAWVTFTFLFSIWHLPALYDLAAEHIVIHATEHICFIFAGLIFWAQMIPSLPFKPRLHPLGQAVYFFVAALWGNALGWAFVFSTTPSYPFYAQIKRTPGMVSAITDQHFAGAVMDATDTILFITCIIIAIGLWLIEEERKAQQETARLALAQAAEQPSGAHQLG